MGEKHDEIFPEIQCSIVSGVFGGGIFEMKSIFIWSGMADAVKSGKRSGVVGISVSFPLHSPGRRLPGVSSLEFSEGATGELYMLSALHCSMGLQLGG